MLQPNEREVQALMDLGIHPGFQVIIKWIERSMTEMALQGMKIESEVKLRHMQGRVLELNDLFSYARNPKEHARRLRMAKEPPIKREM